MSARIKIWNDDDDHIRLAMIVAVQKRPELWDRQSPLFRKTSRKGTVWRDVMHELNIHNSVGYTQVRDEWKKLEKQFWKHQEEILKEGGQSKHLDPTLQHCSFLFNAVRTDLQSSNGDKSAGATSNKIELPSNQNVKLKPSYKLTHSVVDGSKTKTKKMEKSKPIITKAKRPAKSKKSDSSKQQPNKRPLRQSTFKQTKLDQRSKQNDSDYLFAMQIYSKLSGLTPIQRNKAQIELLKVFKNLL